MHIHLEIKVRTTACPLLQDLELQKIGTRFADGEGLTILDQPLKRALDLRWVHNTTQQRAQRAQMVSMR
jgi:hypothetical protein